MSPDTVTCMLDSLRAIGTEPWARGWLELQDGRRVLVVLETRPEGGYTVRRAGRCDWSVVGGTVEEALANAREAADLWLG